MAKRSAEEQVETRKPSKAQRAGARNKVTLCVSSGCIGPGAARTLAQQTHVAYQLAKAATAFEVGEIVVLEEPVVETGGKKKTFGEESSGDDEVALLLATLLQSFVTPPYLQKALLARLPFRKHTKHADRLPKLPNLPFMHNNEVFRDYREGLLVAQHRVGGKSNRLKLVPKTKYVNIGEAELFELATAIPVGVRVTVDLKNKTVVLPTEAYGLAHTHTAKGLFGFSVRVAKHLLDVFAESGYGEQYDRLVYVAAGEFESTSSVELATAAQGEAPQRILLVAMPWKSVERGVGADLQLAGVAPLELFEGQVQVPVGMRVEDAAMVALLHV